MFQENQLFSFKHDPHCTQTPPCQECFNSKMLFNCLFTIQIQADHYFVSEKFLMCIYRARNTLIFSNLLR